MGKGADIVDLDFLSPKTADSKNPDLSILRRSFIFRGHPHAYSCAWPLNVSEITELGEQRLRFFPPPWRDLETAATLYNAFPLRALCWSAILGTSSLTEMAEMTHPDACRVPKSKHFNLCLSPCHYKPVLFTASIWINIVLGDLSGWRWDVLVPTRAFLFEPYSHLIGRLPDVLIKWTRCAPFVAVVFL